MKKNFPYLNTIILGFGFFGISIIWPIFNTYVPIFLKDKFVLSSALIGFVMTWDNYLNMFIQPIVGERSDKTWTKIGRRKPWMLLGVPIAALFFITVPVMRSVIGIMIMILITNIGMALFRSPTVALLGDLFKPKDRSTANGIINLMGGFGGILAFLVGGYLYKIGEITPFIFGSVILVTATTVVFIFVKEPKPEQVQLEKIKTPGFVDSIKQVFKSTDRSGIYILLSILFWFIGFNALETWLSSFGKYTLGIDPGRMSMLTSGLALTFVIFAVPSGLLANKFGRKKVILVGITGLFLLFLFGMAIKNQLMLIAFLIPAGFFWALININSLPMVYDIGGAVGIGAFTGMYYLASNIAAVGGPQIAGILIDTFNDNYRIIFVFSAIFMLLAGIVMLMVKEKKNPTPETETQ